MASAFPGGLDSFSTSHATGETIQAVTDNDQADALNKIEAELGTNPSGGYATLVARLGADNVFNVKEYGAVGDGVTDDVTAIRAAGTAAGAVGGAIYFPPGNGTSTGIYRTSDHIRSHLAGVRRILGYGATIKVTTAMGGGIRRGPIELVDNSNVLVQGLSFIVDNPSNNAAICVSGSSDTTIRDCQFTGSTTGQAAIAVTTAESTASFKNVNIDNCIFRDWGRKATTESMGVEISLNSGRSIDNVTVNRCTFERVARYGVRLTSSTGATVATGRDISITGNWFIDMVGATSPAGGANGPYATGIDGGADIGGYEWQNITVEGNHWRSTRASEAAIFCRIQATKDLKIVDNDAMHTGDKSDSIFIAPGRVTIPQLGLIVTGNYCEGFGAFWDPDSMYYTEVADNVTVNCNPNGGLSTPYSQALDVDIHNNTFRNSYNTTDAAAISTGIPSGAAGTYRNVNVRQNTIIDDQGTPVITKFVYVHGTAEDVSELTIINNKVRVPSGTVTGGYTLQNASITPPQIVVPNSIHDSAGRKPVGPIPSVASAATITLPGTSELFDLTGTTSITSITASWIGRRVTLRFPNGALTLTDSSNLKLAGNLTSAATGDQDTISLICDGTNWFETGRSVN